MKYALSLLVYVFLVAALPAQLVTGYVRDASGYGSSYQTYSTGDLGFAGAFVRNGDIFYSYAEAKADIDLHFGYIKLLADGRSKAGSADDTLNNTAVNSTVYANFSDQLLISAPGYEGRTGTITLRIRLEEDVFGRTAALDMTPNGTISTSIRLEPSNGWTPWTTYYDTASLTATTNSRSSNMPADGIFEFTSNFVVGRPLSFGLQITATGEGSYGTWLPQSAAFYSADMSHSLYFGGVSSLMIGGQQLADYHVTGDRGFDYTVDYTPVLNATAVPEPAQMGYFGAILLIGACLFRFRRSRSATPAV